MAFRFKILSDDTESFTPWYEEDAGATVLVVNKLRAANPDGKFSVERKPVDGATRLDAQALNAVVRDARIKAGWTAAEADKGVRA